ncbi:MAG TPA: hypothetical protein PKA88_29835 [Polyangiaceae bacterium]|nr:hypothetical protein [Polyangiaceae bacterium]
MTNNDASAAELEARLSAHRRVYALVLSGSAAYVVGVLLGYPRLGFGSLGWLLVSAGTITIMRRESVHLESWALSRERRLSLVASLSGQVSKRRVFWNIVFGACLIAAGSWALQLAIVQMG